MKCPKCGHEMVVDEHRRYALHMCYECGYIEGRLAEKKKESNFKHLKNLTMTEAIAFLSRGLNLDESVVAKWLDDRFNP